MANKFGVFSEPPSYISAGDPYVKPRDSSGRNTGLNFKSTIGRTGKLNDGTFDKFKALYEGDRYIDPSKRDRIAQNETKKNNVTETPFKAVSPMKLSSGTGDFYGTLSGKIPYIPGATITVQKKKGEAKSEPRNIVTNPAKKGTYGMNKTTLSERGGTKGISSEYEYHANPSNLEEERRREERMASKKRNVSDMPFRPSNPPCRGGPGVPNRTISKGLGVVGEWEYILGADAKFPLDSEGAGGEDKKAEDSALPFKPSSTHSKHLGKIVEYVHDPELPKIEKVKMDMKTERERLAQSGPWKPNLNLTSRTDMTRSVFRMN
eukprot:CAMPEP_0175063090 /NCGR_PEP_ID=MMETSP0052_2-20121109/14546_1 /TAXON_ID=51329 ORGANISM="Polytomella parva, Strain SAG 63-3" /NCGR_SAMPLE_ID=MMETSP0052_2 /ASSEMBLY_ACC=CAM_ASM_000194 /LENGTH=319 /DNA_ID=CAMNT_0016329215 /DNA_START=140 /DNA_END=1096 /DNA_ORIENTATION=+